MPTINERKISPGQLELQRRIAQAQLHHASTQDHSKDVSEGKREVNMAKRAEKSPTRRSRASRQTQRAQQHRNMQNFNPSVTFEDEHPSYDPRPRRPHVAGDTLSVADIQSLLGNDPSSRSHNVAQFPSTRNQDDSMMSDMIPQDLTSSLRNVGATNQTTKDATYFNNLLAYIGNPQPESD